MLLVMLKSSANPPNVYFLRWMGLFFGFQSPFCRFFPALRGLQTDLSQGAHVRRIVGSHGQYKYLVDSLNAAD